MPGIAAALLALQGCAAWHSWLGASAAARPPLEPSAQDVPRSLPGVEASARAPAPDNTDVSGGASTEAKKVSAPAVRRAAVSDAPTALATPQIGYYMDVLQGRLTQDLGRDARIQRSGDRIIVLLPASFETDSPQMNASGRDILRRVAAILSEYRFTAVELQILGVDADPRTESARLSSDRITVLSRYLTDAGVAGKRLEPSGQPPAAQPAEGAAAPNGVRVELRLTPIGGAL